MIISRASSRELRDEVSDPKDPDVLEAAAAFAAIDHDANGMLCFAEFFMEADGDQVLFDVSQGLVDGEYPVVYYAHAASPASVRVLARSFAEFMEAFLRYEEFADEDEE